MILSCVCRRFSLDDDDVEQDEEDALVADESLWYRPSRRGSGNKGTPIDEQFLDKVREVRQKEVEMIFMS